jgi:hypothetical protein
MESRAQKAEIWKCLGARRREDRQLDRELESSVRSIIRSIAVGARPPTRCALLRSARLRLAAKRWRDGFSVTRDCRIRNPSPRRNSTDQIISPMIISGTRLPDWVQPFSAANLTSRKPGLTSSLFPFTGVWGGGVNLSQSFSDACSQLVTTAREGVAAQNRALKGVKRHSSALFRKAFEGPTARGGGIPRRRAPGAGSGCGRHTSGCGRGGMRRGTPLLLHSVPPAGRLLRGDFRDRVADGGPIDVRPPIPGPSPARGGREI